MTLARGVQLPSSVRAVGDTVEIGPAAQVANAAYNELVGPARVTGTRTSPLRLPILRIPSVASCDPGRTDVTVQPRQSRAIGPGRHGALTVRSQGTLTLAGGTYCVDSITIQEGGNLLFTGPSVVTVRGELDAESRVIIGPSPSAPAVRAHDVVFRVLGIDGHDRRSYGDSTFGTTFDHDDDGGGHGRDHDYWDDDDDDEHDDDDGGPRRGVSRAVDIGPRSVIQANILAPNGGLRLGSDTQATGAFVARWVRVGIRSRLTLDSAF